MTAKQATLADRAASGKATRARVPRSAHGEWQPSADRPHPVALLEEQAASRVPELVPIRYGRMTVSPFTFYRGAAYLMASDLAGTPTTGLQVQLCGDAHLSNFGVFAAPDRRLVFSLNDFDETLPGPFEWDVKRLVASFAVAGRDRGFDTGQRKAINLATVRSYREAIRNMAQMGTLDLWYARLEVDEIRAQVQTQANARERKQFERNVAKARAKDSMKAFSKLVQIVDGRPRLIGERPDGIERTVNPKALPALASRQGTERSIMGMEGKRPDGKADRSDDLELDAWSRREAEDLALDEDAQSRPGRIGKQGREGEHSKHCRPHSKSGLSHG